MQFDEGFYIFFKKLLRIITILVRLECNFFVLYSACNQTFGLIELFSFTDSGFF